MIYTVQVPIDNNRKYLCYLGSVLSEKINWITIEVGDKAEQALIKFCDKNHIKYQLDSEFAKPVEQSYILKIDQNGFKNPYCQISTLIKKYSESLRKNNINMLYWVKISLISIENHNGIITAISYRVITDDIMDDVHKYLKTAIRRHDLTFFKGLSGNRIASKNFLNKPKK